MVALLQYNYITFLDFFKFKKMIFFVKFLKNVKAVGTVDLVKQKAAVSLLLSEQFRDNIHALVDTQHAAVKRQVIILRVTPFHDRLHGVYPYQAGVPQGIAPAVRTPPRCVWRGMPCPHG